jgi:hypothetical protein
MSARNVLAAGAGAGAESLPIGSILREVAPVPGARRWWVEPIHRGVELHGEVGSGHDLAGTRETRLAAGAGLFAVHLAVAVLGTRPVTALLPRAARPGALAILRQGTVQPPTPAERSLYAVLLGAPAPRTVELSALRPFLRRAADAEGAWLHSAAGPGDRVPLREVLAPEVDVPADGLLVLVASSHDLPVCQLQAGRALERVLLTAAVLGHGGRVLAGPGRLDSSRRALQAAGVEPGVVPQALLSIVPRG